MVGNRDLRAREGLGPHWTSCGQVFQWGGVLLASYIPGPHLPGPQETRGHVWAEGWEGGGLAVVEELSSVPRTTEGHDCFLLISLCLWVLLALPCGCHHVPPSPGPTGGGPVEEGDGLKVAAH